MRDTTEKATLVAWRSIMRDTTAELKELRLHGMASAWTDLLAQGESAVATSKWLIEHLLRAEHTDRAMRSVSHQMSEGSSEEMDRPGLRSRTEKNRGKASAAKGARGRRENREGIVGRSGKLMKRDRR